MIERSEKKQSECWTLWTYREESKEERVVRNVVQKGKTTQAVKAKWRLPESSLIVKDRNKASTEKIKKALKELDAACRYINPWRVIHVVCLTLQT